MLTTVEYAKFSANAYSVSTDVVSPDNRIPISSGWSVIGNGNSPSSGFLARAYTNGPGEIIIAYAGTTSEPGMGSTDWTNGNIPAATGAALAAQVLDAAKFYLDIRKANPNASITFTGHSLGGGLASLMAVYFNRPAYTFDEAPFERSADSSYVVDKLRSELKTAGYSLPPELSTYQTGDVSGTTASPTRQERESLVSHTYVKGEILSLGQTPAGRVALAALGYFLLGPLGGVLGGTVTEIAGATQVVDPNAAGNVSPVNLHSMVLLTAFLQSQKFLQISQSNPELLPQVFASPLSQDQSRPERSFLNLMVQQDAAGNEALSTFSDDLAKFAGVLSDSEIKSALYGLAIALHYDQGESKAGTENSPFESLFKSIPGGIKFAPDPGAATTYAESLDALREALKREFVEVAGFLDRNADRYILPTDGQMKAEEVTDGKTDLMLGSVQGDELSSGAGDDVLLGRAGDDNLDSGTGNDILYGGSGDDRLAGGSGFDTYIYYTGDGNDTISEVREGDGSIEGRIIINRESQNLTTSGLFIKNGEQEVWTSVDGAQVTLTHDSAWRISLTDGGAIELGADFLSGDLGIHLNEEVPAPTTFERTIVGDFEPIDFDPAQDGVQTQTDELDNVITNPDQASPDRADLLFDSASNDQILAGGGDDVVLAYRGGKNRIEGGAGADYLIGGSNGDLIEGGDGADVMRGGAGADKFYAGTETTVENALAQQDAAPSGLKGDFFDGGAGNDTLIGDSGNDFFGGGAGDDLMAAGAGDDDIWSDVAPAMVGVDWKVERSVTTYPEGGTYYLSTFNFLTNKPEGGDDVIYAGAGIDWVMAGDGGDYVDGGIGDDVLFGEGGNDDVFGGDGSDVLVGDGAQTPLAAHGNDYLDGEAGDDELWGFGGGDTMFGGDGNDALYGDVTVDGAGDDYLDGEAGDDTLFGGAQADTVFGGDGADFLQGDSGTGAGDGDDYLDGEAGTDTLFGEGGNDELIGGDDADLLIGGEGRDTLHGDAGNDQLAGDNGGADTGGDADQIYGGDGDDLIDAQGGNDFASGGNGNDIVVGGLDNDTLVGDAGNDQLQGGSGNDTLDGGGDSDILFGEEGNDALVGGDGNDYLIGGLGDDTIDGGNGNDVYYYTMGEGRDRIVDSGGTDWLVFTDVFWGQITVGVGSLKLTLPDGGEVHLDDFDPDNPLAGAIEYFQFADGTVKTRQQLIQSLGFKIEGTPGDDVLSGTAWGEPIHAYAGNDIVTARAGNDAIDLGEGDDFADAGDGNDTVQAGEGNDMVLGGNGADQLDGGLGSDLLFGDAGDDQLSGGLGDDLLAGGAGNDLLLGGEGNDNYRFGVGAGIDVAIDGVGTNAVQLDGGLVPDEVSFKRLGDDLVVAVPGTTDQLTVQGWFAAAGSGWTIAFDDGTVLDRAAVEERLQLNQAPVLTTDAVAVGEDGVVQISGNALTNDSDPEGRALRVSNPGTYGGAYGALSLSAGGSFTYTLNNGGATVQSLAAGQTVSDQFSYTASDDDPAGAMTSTSAIVVAVTGANDAPVVQADTAAVGEDGTLLASGNVLANDHDIDTGTVLGVAVPGSTSTAHGTLTLATDGAYAYALNNGATAVQSLGRAQQVTEHFTYAATDGLASIATSLDITVAGANDAPFLTVPLADQVATPNKDWTWQLPANSFTEIDQGDALAYTASLADGSPLPSWLSFDAATQTFSGRVPRTATGALDIQVTAADRVTATGSTVGSLATSDVFRLDFGTGTGGGGGGSGGGGNGGGSQGNEGVGNGVDAPPPGHETSFNDGPGTSPGDPGAAGGNGLGNDDPYALPAAHGAAPTKHEVFVAAPELSLAAVAAPGHARRQGNGAGPTRQSAEGGAAAPAPTSAAATGDAVVASDTALDGGAGHTATPDPATASLDPLLADWGQPQALPAYLNAQQWQEAAASWAAANGATGDAASAFADWLATDLALAEALADRKGVAWLDGVNGADVSALSGLRAGYLGSRVAFREDAFSLLAGNGQSLKTFTGLGQGAQKIA